MEERKSVMWNIWTWLWKLIAFVPDVIESWIRWSSKWIVDLVDFSWDIAGWATDLVTNLVTGWNWTNIWSKEWWLDKASKKTKWVIDKYWDTIKSDIWETAAWKWILWAAELAWEVFTPWAWLLTGWLKWLKIWKKAWDSFKKIPWAKKELDLLIKSWNKIEQSQIDDLVKKYWAWAVDTVKKEATAPAKYIWDTKELKIWLKDLKNLKAEEIAKLPQTLKNKVWMVLWAWTLWSSVAMDFWDEINEKDLEEINNILGEESKDWEEKDWEEKKDDKQLFMYKWRKIEKNDDWTFSFISKDWSWREKTFKSMDELKFDVDSLWTTYEWDEDFKKAEVTFNKIKETYPDANVNELLWWYLKENKIKDNSELASKIWFTEYDWSDNADIELLYKLILKLNEWISI